MGFNIGENPTDLSLLSFPGSASTYDINNAACYGYATLLTFIHIRSENDWLWLKKLEDLYDDVNLKKIAVIFNWGDGSETFPPVAPPPPMFFSGPVTDDWITVKRDYYGLTQEFDWVKLETAYAGSVVSQYVGSFGTFDSPGTFLIDKNYVIAQKFDYNTGVYSSIDDMYNSMVPLIDSLLLGPTIDTVVPSEATTINSLSTLSVTFSENVLNADVTTNYTLSGSGLGTLSVNPTNATQDAVISEKYNLTFSGDPDDGYIDITLANITDTVFNTPVALTDTIINYTADVTNPTPTLSLPSGVTAPVNGTTFDVEVDFGETVHDFTAGAAFITSANASITGKTPNADAQVFTLTVTPSVTQGTINIRVPASVTTDLAGLANDMSAVFPVSYDNVKPAPAITSTDVTNGGSTSLTSFDVTIAFGEPVEEIGSPGVYLAPSHLGLVNCTVAAGDISANVDHSSFTVTVHPTANGAVSITANADQLEDDAGNPNSVSNTFSVTYTAPVVSTNKDIMILMDMSDSMNWPVSIEGSAMTPKINFMRPQIQAFMDKLITGVGLGMTDAADRYSLIRYSSAAQIVQVNGADMNRFDAVGDDPVAIIGSQTANGSTAMGPAMEIAYNQVNHTQNNATYGRGRAMVLFADGQDNVPPNVVTTGSGFSIGGTVSVDQSDAEKIPVHTIGIHTETYGDTSSWLAKLGHISTVTDGVDRATPGNEIWPEAGYDFDDIYQAIYNGSSPKNIFRADGTLTGTSVTKSFYLNKAVKSMMITVSWPENVPCTIKLRKGTTTIPVSEYDEHVIRGKYKIIGINFPCVIKRYVLGRALNTLSSHLRSAFTRFTKPAEIKEKTVSGLTPAGSIKDVLQYFFVTLRPGGQWDVIVERDDKDSNASAPYSLSVIAEEKAISCKAYIPHNIIQTGKVIDLDIFLKELNVPVENILESNIQVISPRTTLANVIAKYSHLAASVRGKASAEKTKEPVSVHTEIEEKVKSILEIPEALAELSRKRVETVSLKPSTHVVEGQTVTEKGHFVSRYTRTTVPGTYKIRIRVKGIGAKTGVFERVLTQKVMVLPAIDKKASLVEQKYEASSGILRLVVTPKDRYGNLLGPGYADRVSATFAEEKNIKVKDHLTGTYEIEIKAKGLKAGKAKQDRITMAGMTLAKINPDDLK